MVICVLACLSLGFGGFCAGIFYLLGYLNTNDHTDSSLARNLEVCHV
jgi:hypothetical protein